ncbi:MAG: UDP-3-O-acyl-N-acetylglucosamine deacetylase [candidate division Zixibacteria bacterium]|nr:UDP-3-O-acyl-N-acetylglucosamine deacetylase [candidate division Zixibacteria bacterium]
MYEKQRTVKRPISLTGAGLHTGNSCTMTFKPAEPNTGIRFVRTDIAGHPGVMADIDHVVDISRGTTLQKGEARVHTVEHVLAAFAGLQIDNIIVELDSNEPPVGDGSALPYVDCLLEAGIEDQDVDKVYLEIDTPMSYSEPERRVDLVVTPSNDLRITFMIDYQNPALGTQYTTLQDLEKEFVDEFAPARTFCFLSEIEMLKAQGLIKGGGLHNAIVIYDSDKGQIEVDRIRKALDLKDEAFVGETGIINALFDTQAVLKVLPHRYPMLLVDRILDMEPGKRVVGIKNVTFNEPFFQGHFPDHPIMPGVLILEAMAQAGGVLLLNAVEHPETKLPFFVSIDNAKFRRTVVPGDQLRFELTMEAFRHATCKMTGKAYVEDQLVCSADFKAMVVDR